MSYPAENPTNSPATDQVAPGSKLGGEPILEFQPQAGRPRRGPTQTAGASRARLQAAASLIGDESKEVRQALLQEFRRVGKLGTPHLQRAARSSDALVRSHGRAILDTFDREQVLRRLTRFASRERVDLEAALCVMSGLDRADLNMKPYRKALDAMAEEVTKRTCHLRDDLQKAQVLVHYMGTELGYRGEVQDYSHPDKIYLHRAIELKRGLPLTLCSLYSFVARRAGIKTGIVPLPGHVMLRLYGRYQNLIVDPFHGGEARTQEELGTYLREHGLRFNPVWMHDASDKMLLARQLANLQNALRAIGLPNRASALDPLLMQFRR